MDKEKNYYKFCSLSDVDGSKCPGTTIKTPIESGLEESTEEVKQDGQSDNVIGNAVDLAIKMVDVKNPRPDLSLNFLFGSEKMYQESIERLKTNINKLRGKKVILKGYTDNFGVFDRNNYLALERANEVKRILHEYGFNNEDIKTEGYPLCCYTEDNLTDENRKKNRRVEIFLYN